MVYDESKKPTDAELKKVVTDEVSMGKFQGWGYYYSITNDLFRKAYPLYIKIDKQVKISMTPASDP